MSYYLQYLIPTSGLVAAYPLDNDVASATTITDESGNGRTLNQVSGIGFQPFTPQSTINNTKAVVHDADNDHVLLYTGSMTVAEAHILGKVDETTTFPGSFRGLLTDLTTVALLTGKGGTTRWLSIAEGSPSTNYYKSDVAYIDTNRQAPFTQFERMRVTGSAGTWDGFTFGRDRADAARIINAKWANAFIYSAALSDTNLAKIKLYNDLKHHTWLIDSTTLRFPDPALTDLPYRHWYAPPPRREPITISHEYDDGGRSFNRISDTPTKEWELEIDIPDSTHALSKLKYDVYDAFYDAVGIDKTFSFLDKYGTTWTDVRVKDYSRSHKENRSWVNFVRFTLCMYP